MAARTLQILTLATMFLVGLVIMSCGGGDGGAGVDGAGQGLVLTSFSAEGVSNVPLNTRLEFRFSEDVDPATIHAASLQIREGPAFGSMAPGVYIVEGATVVFEPFLPSLCDLSDAGFRPDTSYRVQAIGFPEEFSVRNTSGQSLSDTQTYEFHTRTEQDAGLFLDQDPQAFPEVIGVSPANGAEAVTVADGNAVVVTLSENILPCSVHEVSATLKMYEIGDIAGATQAPNGNDSGFAKSGDTADQTPTDPYTWGADGTTSLLAAPQTIPASLELRQDFYATELHIVPVFGRFPENALLVVELTFQIADFGSNPLTPFVSNFTTQNLSVQNSDYLVANEGETPYLEGVTTAKVNVPGLCEGKVQGFLLFAGDGDNGSQMVYPGAPEYDAPDCLIPRDVNDGSPDHFSPVEDVLLDTGSTRNMCPNTVDGSYAVVWEFASLYIGPQITVRIVGVNPAILLVQGDATIDTGGRLLLKGGDGQKGKNYPSGAAAEAAGGRGVAGGGDGGASPKALGAPLGEHGFAGYGSPDYDLLPQGGSGGAGHGNAAVGTSSYTSYPCSASGGGGGHSTAGTDGTANAASGGVWKAPIDGAGGTLYPTGASVEEMLTPSAGSGGGGAGWATGPNDSTYYQVSGGGGGAGGGFVDITAAGNIRVFGEIDASGGKGGDGNFYYTNRPCTGGGGGGSGGGIRLLTPLEIDVSGGTLNAAGGAGGRGAVLTIAGAAVPNDGGAGASGRIVLEDGDSLIKGQSTGVIAPPEGSPGFYRGGFQASRFAGGGRRPVAISDKVLLGPFNPQFIDPVQKYDGSRDFVVGVPVGAGSGLGKTTMLIEARGFEILADGTAAAVPHVDWHTVGHFTDSGVPNQPAWNLNQPDSALLPADNMGLGISALDGCEYMQFRITYFLPDGLGALDAGPYVDDWTIRFTHDQ